MRTAAQTLWLVSSNPVLRQAAAPNLARTDSVLDAYVRAYRGGANDVRHAVEASHDYDPAPGLERIKAPLMAVNSARCRAGTRSLAESRDRAGVRK